VSPGTERRDDRLSAVRHRTAITLALASAVLFGACTGGGSASAGPGGSALDLDGRTFLSTAVQGRSLVAGTTVRISFTNGGVGASAGCNSMGGPYRIDGDRLIAGQLAMTEMACDPPLMEQDLWVAELLGAATIALDGETLALTNRTVRLTLLDRELADPDRPLLGTRWVVDGLISGDAVSSVPVGVTAALTFSDGRVDVEAGCNEGGGTVRIADGTIDFGPIGLTKKACPPGMMAVEGAVTAVLAGSVGYDIEAGVLTLDAGNVGLMLRATP
jgi:heat shock protein HslJ